MSLKFKDIITEDDFHSVKGGKLKPKEEKLLKNIHNYILVSYFDDQQLPSELLDLTEYYELYYKIYDFLIDTMLFDSVTASHLFNLFVLNYNREGEYTNIEEIRTLSHEDEIEMFGGRVMALAKHFNTLPFMVERLDFSHYGIPSYVINGRDEWYAFGNQADIDYAVREMLDHRWSEREVFNVFDAEGYVAYCNVSDTDKRIISNEDADHYESEQDPEEIINYLRHNRENDKDDAIVLDYDEMVEELEESSTEDESHYEVRIGEIVNNGRERVREIIYNVTYTTLENNLEEYLTELGYLMDEGSSHERWERLPSWITFDWKEFMGDEIRNFDINELSPYENVDEIYSENGDIYYIIQIEY